MATRILPLELIDKAIGSRIWILMRGSKEIVGTLRGFDDYVSIEYPLEVTELEFSSCHTPLKVQSTCVPCALRDFTFLLQIICSPTIISRFLRLALFYIISMQVNLVLDDAVEFSPDPYDKAKFIRTELNSEILLNGNQIAILIPGGTGPPENAITT